jgi:hypothetical protein
LGQANCLANFEGKAAQKIARTASPAMTKKFQVVGAMPSLGAEAHFPNPVTFAQQKKF